MTFQAHSAARVADVDFVAERVTAAPSSFPLAANDVADPESGWASRNPDRALLFLYVTPRDCAALEELMAL